MRANSVAIKVAIRKRASSKFWQAFWLDENGRKCAQSTKQTKHREAERFAARLEMELNQGQLTRQSTLSDLRFEFESQRFPFLREKTAQGYANVFNQLEKFFGSDVLIGAINSQQVSRWQAKMKARGRSDYTIHTYLRTLKVILNWAVQIEWLERAPKISMPRTAKRGLARGRALSVMEVVRALRHWHDVVPAEDVANWQFLMRGLLYSGLRISEALELDYERGPVQYVHHDRPFIRFLAEGQKANRDQIMPVTPHLARLLDSQPGDNRKGRVFNPTHYGERVNVFGISKRISKVFEVAEIYVEDAKTATAHDLRRTFGLFWATRLKPIQLKTLMRHSTIETTLKFYVDLPTADVSDAVWS